MGRCCHPHRDGVSVRVWRDMSDRNLTELLAEVGGGNQAAIDALFERVYGELRRLAGDYFRRERPDHTMQPTALVHEAYVRLVGSENVAWENRAHFFNVAAQVMRNIIVDHARRHKAEKRGSGQKVSLDEALSFSSERNIDLIELDEALTKLAELDIQQSRIVELRFFGGLKIEEVAAVLNISETTVSREWLKAKLWLRSQLTQQS
jgi:RNA polymerase sigma-70 factor, ECF subfamily